MTPTNITSAPFAVLLNLQTKAGDAAQYEKLVEVCHQQQFAGLTALSQALAEDSRAIADRCAAIETRLQALEARLPQKQ